MKGGIPKGEAHESLLIEARSAPESRPSMQPKANQQSKGCVTFNRRPVSNSAGMTTVVNSFH